MKRLMLCLLAVVVLTGCIAETPQERLAKQIGEQLRSAYVVDAPTGKCLQIYASGEMSSITVVDPALCSR